MDKDLDQRIQTLSQWLYESKYPVVFTGAGISTESGLPEFSGYPLKMAEMLSLVSPRSYIARSSVHDVKNILAAKKAIREAFLVQIRDEGFGLVEVLAACPTNWRLDPVSCMERIKSEVIPYYPLGTFSRTHKET